MFFVWKQFIDHMNGVKVGVCEYSKIFITRGELNINLRLLYTRFLPTPEYSVRRLT